MVSLAHLSYSLCEPSVKDQFTHLTHERTRALVIWFCLYKHPLSKTTLEELSGKTQSDPVMRAKISSGSMESVSSAQTTN